MAPKPGNAFAQQKELQQQEKLDNKPREADMPDTPMTTMSMFIGPDLPSVDSEGPAELKTPTNVDPSNKGTTGRRKQGQRAFTDPAAVANSQSAGPPDISFTGKQSSGFNYIKSKFAGKSRKNKDSEISSQPSTNPAPSEYLSSTLNSAAWSNFCRIGAAPEAAPAAMAEKLPSQPLPSHLSTATTRTVATPESRYASLLKNDAMILGNISMSPTRSDSYAMVGCPAVVSASHPSIMSMAGSIFGPSSRDSSATTNPGVFNSPFALAGPYDTSHTAPLPPPPGEESLQQSPFQHQLPYHLQMQSRRGIDQTNIGDLSHSYPQYDTSNSGAWEQLHAQHPSTMPQFSPVNTPRLHRDLIPKGAPGQTADNADELQKEATLESLYNANASDTKSENGKEVLEALEDAEDAAAEFATPLKGSIRRSASDPEVSYSSYQVESPNKTPVARKVEISSAQLTKSSQVLSSTAPLFGRSARGTSTLVVPTIPKSDQYEGYRPEHSEPLQGLLPNFRDNNSSTQGASAPFYVGESNQGSTDPNGTWVSSALSYETTRGGYPPTSQHPHYQARSSLEEQMAHQFNIIHHHMEAVKYTLRCCIEDAKNFTADAATSSQIQITENCMNQFRQLCIQNNGFRQYLERIQLQTTNLRQGIVADVVPAMSFELKARFREQEQRSREDFKRLKNDIFTLNENVNAIHCNLSKQVTQMNKKLDLLLESQGLDTSNSGQFAHQDRAARQPQRREEVSRAYGEFTNPAAMVEKKSEVVSTPAALSSAVFLPITQVLTPQAKNRKPTPMPAKTPIMAASLTSTPPHVPQMPPSQPQSSSIATVTITDPSIPSPSAVSNARRVKHGHAREQGEARKENAGAGILANNLADATSTQEPGTQVHPALRSQKGIDWLTGRKLKQTEEKDTRSDNENELLGRWSLGDGEIGGKWYEAAMQQ